MTLLLACTSPPRSTPPRAVGGLNLPAAVAVSEAGDVALSDLANAAVVVIPADDAEPEPILSSPRPVQARFRFPSGLAYGDDGTLYVVESAKARIRAVRPDGTEELIRVSAREGPEQFGLIYPIGLAVDGAGTLWVADAVGHRVLEVTPDGSASVIAGSTEPEPEPDFFGDGGPAAQARFAYPGALALGPDGSLYVADTGNRRVRRIAPDGTITTVAGNGTRRFSGDGGPATEAGIGTPRALALDPRGNLYLSAGDRVRGVTPEGTITTIAGTDRPGCTGDGGPGTRARLSLPMGLAVDLKVEPGGMLYIADRDNGLVRGVSSSGQILTALAVGEPPVRTCF